MLIYYLIYQINLDQDCPIRSSPELEEYFLGVVT
nr:MAG TPA: hypothetical protein [Caudoviricetes sp.]